MFVYFIQIGKDGPVKIGSTNNVDSRLQTLQVASPSKLRILAVERGTYEREKALHYRFRAARLKGEWFDYSNQDIRTYLKGLPVYKPTKHYDKRKPKRKITKSYSKRFVVHKNICMDRRLFRKLEDEAITEYRSLSKQLTHILKIFFAKRRK